MAKTTQKISPPQLAGRTTGATATEKCATRSEAIALYNRARKRLLDINRWYEYTGESVVSGKFFHTDKLGTPVDRAPQPGDYIKIDLPGPGPDAGDGFDWVRIEAIEDSDDSDTAENAYCALRVRPAPNPTTASDETAHFYTELATSSFQVTRKGNEVVAEETGRNELPNNEEVDGTKDKIRNTVYAETASRGAAVPQWKVLMEGLIKKE